MRAKVVLVTGAARGLGSGIAERFAQAGFAVHRGDIAGGSLHMDVTERASVKRALEEIGPLDVLVNNAGVLATGPVRADRRRGLRQVPFLLEIRERDALFTTGAVRSA